MFKLYFNFFKINSNINTKFIFNMVEHITIVFNPINKILDKEGNKKDINYLIDNIDRDKYIKFIDSLNISSIDNYFIFDNIITKYISRGTYYCDTYQTEDGWRIQFKVNIHIQPCIVELLQHHDNRLIVWYENDNQTSYYKDYVVITFTI